MRRRAGLLLILAALAAAPMALAHGSTDASLRARVRVLTAVHLQQCWPHSQSGGDVAIVVAVPLAQDGTLDGAPRVVTAMDQQDPSLAAAAEAVLQGAIACAPYPYPLDPVLAGHPEHWREVEITFVAPQ